MIVLDASALAEFVVGSAVGKQIRDRLSADGFDVHVPHLCSIEVASVLRAWVRRGVMDPARAARALEDLAAFRARRYVHELLLPRVWELRDSLSAYDALYVALAEELAAPLITLDGRLARAPGHRALVEVFGG